MPSLQILSVPNSTSLDVVLLVFVSLELLDKFSEAIGDALADSFREALSLEIAAPGVKFSGVVTVSLAAGAGVDSEPVGVALVSEAIMSGVTMASVAGAAASAVGVGADGVVEASGAGAAASAVGVGAGGVVEASGAGAAASAVGVGAGGVVEAAGVGFASATFVCAAVGVGVSGCAGA